MQSGIDGGATARLSRRHGCTPTRWCLTAILLVANTGACAHPFCVSDANALQDALTQASDNGAYNGEDNFINIVQGTYFTGTATNNKPFSYASTAPGGHSLHIAGGFRPGCFQQQIAAVQTVLDGSGATGVLSLQNLHGDISISNLTIQNGHSNQIGAGLQINHLNNLGGGVNVTDTIIRHNSSSANAGGLYLYSVDYVSVSANLIVDNHSDKQYGAGQLIGNGPTNSFQVYNNTVTQNTSGASTNPVGGLYCSNAFPTRLFNNIFWFNTGAGLYLDSDFALDHNDIGMRAGTAPGSEHDDLAVAPRFVNTGNSNFHLRGDSPLLGFGVTFAVLQDLDGYSYPFNPFGGRVDLGAYAETIFIDGLDLP